MISMVVSQHEQAFIQNKMIYPRIYNEMWQPSQIDKFKVNQILPADQKLQ